MRRERGWPLVLVRLAPVLLAFGCGHAAPADVQPATSPPAPLKPDFQFVDQEGRPTRFFADVVRDRIVFVSFIYTSCKGSCPSTGANFARIATKLEAERETSISLVSISIDAEDTPQKLKQWSERFAGPKWPLLCGPQATVEKLTESLIGSPVRKGEHMPAILMGNGATGQWTRVYALHSPDELVAMAHSFQSGFDPAAP